MVVARRRKYTPRYRRRYRYAGRYRRGYSITRSLYNGTRRFVMQQRARVSMTFTIPANATTSNVVAGSPWGIVPVAGGSSQWVVGPTNNTNYRRLVELFDECKCDWLEVRLLPSQGITNGTNMSVYMWVDRKFTSDELQYPTVSIGSCPSAKEYRITSTSTRSAVMRVYASDLHERITYHDCTRANDGDAAWVAGKDIGFMPGIMACLQLDGAPSAAVSVPFNIEVVAQYTFRNVKFQ